jgi:hypothetical protein
MRLLRDSKTCLVAMGVGGRGGSRREAVASELGTTAEDRGVKRGTYRRLDAFKVVEVGV